MRLSEFKDEKAIEVVANLIGPISRIAAHKDEINPEGLTQGEFVGKLLKTNSNDVMEMLAVLNDQDPAEYHCNAATVMVDVLGMFSDPDLMQLFSAQGQTTASSGSASVTIEGQKG